MTSKVFEVFFYGNWFKKCNIMNSLDVFNYLSLKIGRKSTLTLSNLNLIIID